MHRSRGRAHRREVHPYAGHHVGTGYSVQSNLMGNDKVVGAMSQAYEAAKGDLADRMIAALDAAQAVGGDIRGCQSAAILVVSGKRSDTPWPRRSSTSASKIRPRHSTNCTGS